MTKPAEVFTPTCRLWFTGKGERVKLPCLSLAIKITDTIYYRLMYFSSAEKVSKITKFVIFFGKKVISTLLLIGSRFVSRKFAIKILANWEARVLVYLLILTVIQYWLVTFNGMSDNRYKSPFHFARSAHRKWKRKR